MNQRIGEIPIGTYGEVCTIRPDETIITALRKFLEKRVSALPVVDANGVLVDIYSKFDVIVRIHYWFLSIILFSNDKFLEIILDCSQNLVRVIF